MIPFAITTGNCCVHSGSGAQVLPLAALSLGFIGQLRTCPGHFPVPGGAATHGLCLPPSGALLRADRIHLLSSPRHPPGPLDSLTSSAGCFASLLPFRGAAAHPDDRTTWDEIGVHASLRLRWGRPLTLPPLPSAFDSSSTSLASILKSSPRPISITKLHTLLHFHR